MVAVVLQRPSFTVQFPITQSVTAFVYVLSAQRQVWFVGGQEDTCNRVKRQSIYDEEHVNTTVDSEVRAANFYLHRIPARRYHSCPFCVEF
jgi:hypothetical protein